MFQKRNDLEVFNLLATPHHLRGIAQALKIAPATIKRILDRLEQERVLERTIQGKNHVFSRKHTPEALQYIYLTEHYRLLHALQDAQMRLLVKHIRSTTNELVVLFGSRANNTHSSDSDIDLFIETKNSAVLRSIQEFSPKISIQSGTLQKDSVIAQEIYKNHVIVQGVERFHYLYDAR